MELAGHVPVRGVLARAGGEARIFDATDWSVVPVSGCTH
jgi:hypothetical protein